jgi:hypothetical protein
VFFTWFWSLDQPTRAAFIAGAATFATAALTLLGVGIGLYVNRRSQQEERRLTLRREVYLNAANRYATSAQLLSSMPDPTIEIRTAAAPILGEFAAAVAQVQLVGHDRVIKASVALHREYTNIYLAMVTKRMRLEELKNTLNANNARLAQISNLRLQAESAVTIASQEFARIQKQNAELSYELLDEQLRLTKEVIGEYDKLLPFSMEATLSAKQEFGIRIEEIRYTQFMTESAQAMKDSVSRALKEVEDRIAVVRHNAGSSSAKSEVK